MKVEASLSDTTQTLPQNSVSEHSHINWKWLVPFSAISSAVGLSTTPHMGMATFIYTILIFGLIHRKSRVFHSKTMTLAIIADISLVLLLEMTRSAVNTAVKFDLSLGQQIHIVTSLVTVLLYLPLLFMGLKMLFNESLSAKYRNWHIRLGGSAMIFRTLGLITMFYFLK